MSYLNLQAAQLPNISKAVISVWFRVPQASITAALAAYVPMEVVTAPNTPTNFGAPVPFNGIIPIVTFGAAPDAYKVWLDAYTDVPYNLNRYLMTGGCMSTLVSTDSVGEAFTSHTMGASYQLPPCFIGVDCSDPFSDGKAHLTVGLQTTDFAGTYTNAASGVSGVTVSGDVNDLEGASFVFDGGGGLCPGVIQMFDPYITHTDQNVFSTPWTKTTTWVDQSDLFKDSAPEVFGGLTAGDTGFGASPTIIIEPDKWHHLLLSFDLTGTVTAHGSFDGSRPDIASTCRMWVAFDDVNYTGTDLPNSIASLAGAFDSSSITQPADLNAIITQRAVSTVSSVNTTDPGFNGPTGAWHWEIDSSVGLPTAAAEYIYSPTGLPTLNAPFGIPAYASFVNNIHKVEMAEFQLYTGVTLNTGDISNRRAFINTAGKPILGTSSGTTLLGKAPDIAFVRHSKNWIIGHDSGSLKPGHFRPTGKIKSFFPSPKLGT